MPSKRRSNHTGSIRKREDRGHQFQAQFTMPDGRRLTRSFNTERAGQVWLREMENHTNRGMNYDLAQLKLKSGLSQWLDDKKRTWKPKTYQQNSNVVNKYVLPHVPASLQVMSTKPHHIRVIIEAIEKTCIANGVGTRTISYARNMLFAYFESLCKEQLLTYNPVRPVETKHEPSKMQVLDMHQVHQLFNAAKDTYLEHLWYIGINTGMREGELLGLRWSDISFDHRCIMVQQQVQWRYGKDLPKGQPRYTFESLKTDASRRRIALGPKAMQVLQDQRTRLMMQRFIAGKRWDERDLVFPNQLGRPLEPTNVTRILKALLKKANLPNIRFHDLRHTCATLLLLMGVHPKIVSERLGHSSVQITLDIYSHVLPGLQALAAIEMDSLLHKYGPDAQQGSKENGNSETPKLADYDDKLPTPEQPGEALTHFDQTL